MLVLNPASAAGVAYWQRSAVYSQWLGQGATLLDLSGAVSRDDLRSVLRGERPPGGTTRVDAEPLTARPGLRRRHGWDLVFAAPKSVSLLAQAEPVAAALDLRSAHRQAVGDAIGMLEEKAAWLRSGGAQVAAQGVVAAAFEHMANDAGHPHLHTHVVLANLGVKEGGQWGCLMSTELWRWREGIAAGFQLALRSRLGEAGYGFKWELSEGGSGEIVSVPAQARSAASSRSLTVRAGARSFGAASSATQRGAQVTTRRASRIVAAAPTAAPATVGWGAAAAAKVLQQAKGQPALPSPPPAPAAVTGALAARGSAFGEPDVLVALAETSPGGLSLRQAIAWAGHWCAASPTLSPPLTGAGPAETGSLSTTMPTKPTRPTKRWTTAFAQRLDQTVIDLATEARFAHMAEVMPALAEAELGDLRTSSGVITEAVRLACGPDGVDVLPRGPWLAQAACIDAARAAWQAAGMTVQLACPSELSARRWRALTSLQAGAPGGRDGARTNPGRRALVVDAADHLSPKALVSLLERAASSRTKVVLVQGGTVPGTGPSIASSLDQLAYERGGTAVAVDSLALWRGPSAVSSRDVSVAGIVVRGALTGRDALSHTVQAWSAMATPGSGTPLPVMVAFGPAEAEALNRAARPGWLQRHGTGRTPATGGGQWPPARPSAENQLDVLLGERRYAMGERVLALRRIGRATSATFGAVVGLGARSVTVEWQGAGGSWRAEVGPGDARALGYGYATTVPYLRSSDKTAVPLLVLGDPVELGARSTNVGSAWVTVAGPGRPAFGLSGVAARHRAAIGELAVSWPDAEMLDVAGPRPMSMVGRRRWAEAVVACAVHRDLGLAPPGLATTSARIPDNLACLRAGNSPYLESRFVPPSPGL